MKREFPLPPDQIEAAERWLADRHNPSSITVEARPASTVMLLREADDHPFDVYMVRRAKTMAHTPGVCAFPGGSVRSDDDDFDVPYLGLPMSEWARIMGTDEMIAHRSLLTAVRETFEESRVMLARNADGSPATGGEAWEPQRRLVEGHALDFGDLLRSEGLTIDLCAAGFRGVWVTPEYLPRRYAVSFFTVRIPQGQEPVLASTEATVQRWDHPQNYLDRADAGEVGLVAPTRVQLEELAACSSIEEALTHKPRTVMFEPRKTDHGYVLEWN